MKVYIIVEGDIYGTSEIIAVYSSEEEAQRVVKEKGQKSHSVWYAVEQWEVK